MIRSRPSAAIIAVILTSAASLSFAHPRVIPRVTNSSSLLLPCYDYVVVGGGTAGLTVASRLSENPETTVLIIEAGELDQREDYIEIPGLSGGAVGTKYDWNLSYVANPDVASRALPIYQGKVVGGSSLLNRMLFHRGSVFDYDRWEALGNTGWSWAGILPYFRKSEAFVGPNANISADYGVAFDPFAHGYDGNVHATYSPWVWPSVRSFISAAQELQINTPEDGTNGEAYGGFFVTHAQDAVTVTRSSARKAYYDTADTRPNLHLLTGNHVTRLLTTSGTDVKVTGVEFATSSNETRQKVKVDREAIMAAGSLHTPQILQLSGIADSALLSQFNITPVVDLPGVGYNLHDHISVSNVFNVDLPIAMNDLITNATFAAQARALYDSQKTGPFSTATDDFLFFLPTQNFTNSSASLHEQASAQDPNAFLEPCTPESVATGYAAQQKLLVEGIGASDAATLEIIPSDGTMVVGLMHPFSRGSVKIQSTNPFDAPLADVGFLRNPLDVAMLVEAVKFARTVARTPALAQLSATELVPGTNVTTDAALESFVRNSSSSLYHPAGSCVMGKKEEGGCVDSQLRVYGVDGLRIVDASVIPLLPAAHIMATVYAIAEKAVDAILGSSSYDLYI